MASSQIISPGKLASVHAPLEGVRNCTQCHQLRKKGISPALCLDCHEPLARRVAEERGFHSTLAEPDCASCHRDHYGEDFGLVRLDTTTFDHERTGYTLEGRHGQAERRQCHTVERIQDEAVPAFKGEHEALGCTFLGLPTTCQSCHETDDPHGDDFPGRACTEFHDTNGWEEAPGFDHDEAAYRLTGRHRSSTCWSPARSPMDFDHAGQGGFELTGSHMDVDCATCHLDLRFEQPDTAVQAMADDCATCHLDVHRGRLGTECSSCHDTFGLRAVDGDMAHARTAFPLSGAHLQVTCESCHTDDRDGA